MAMSLYSDLHAGFFHMALNTPYPGFSITFELCSGEAWLTYKRKDEGESMQMVGTF